MNGISRTPGIRTDNAGDPRKSDHNIKGELANEKNHGISPDDLTKRQE